MEHPELAEDEQVRMRLRSRTWSVVDSAIRAAVGMGHRGDVLLAERLAEAPMAHRVHIAASLGDLRGASGDAALRRQLAVTGPGTQDLRCAVLLALAKRLDEDASDCLAEGLRSGIGAVRDYAAFGLAAVGDDRCWDDMVSWFVTRARSHQNAHESPVPIGFAYLGRHATSRTRLESLTALVRRAWPKLDSRDQDWLLHYWPGFAPDRADVPDQPSGEALKHWVRANPLFSAPVH
jgi:hypothetical protein